MARAVADKKRPVPSQRGWLTIDAASQDPVQSTADARNNASVRALGTNKARPRVAGNPRRHATYCVPAENASVKPKNRNNTSGRSFGGESVRSLIGCAATPYR